MIREIAVEALTELHNRKRALREEIVHQLADSMKAVGLINPITVRPDASGYVLIAGSHRWHAAKLLKWESIQAHIVEGMDAVDAELMEIDENLIKADLSPAERSIHFAERKRLYEERHPETKHGATGRGGKRDANLASFSKDAASKTRKGERTISRDVERATKISDIASVVGTCLDKGDELDALAELPEDKQRSLIATAASGEKVSAKNVLKRILREEKEHELGAYQIALPTKQYGVIYADPPWRFEPYSRETGIGKAADNHYPTMRLDQIKEMEVPAAKDCVLFLWATVPMEGQAHSVMSAWGFTYKSQLVWVKDHAGTGYWFRNQHEVLLVGTRGSVPAPAPGTQARSAIHVAVSAHSVKPAVFRELIEQMFPTLPRLEMFARGSIPGWDVWGNQAA
jgi:N6-adenosine-specific RNA methylase IME4/ParB-like chromosome segregation protein Spo0J